MVETTLPDGLETSGRRVYRLFWHISRRFWVFPFWITFSVLDYFFRFKFFFVFVYSWSTLLWYRCYYPHQSRDSMSPVCGIFTPWTKGFGQVYFINCGVVSYQYTSLTLFSTLWEKCFLCLYSRNFATKITKYIMNRNICKIFILNQFPLLQKGSIFSEGPANFWKYFFMNMKVYVIKDLNINI